MVFNQTLFKRGQERGRSFTKKPGMELISTKTKKNSFEVNVFNTTLDTLIQQIRARFQAAEKTTNRFSFLWLSESKSRLSEEEENKLPSLEEKSKTLAQIYVNYMDAEKLIGEVCLDLDTLKRANLFGAKQFLTSMKLLNGIYPKGLQSLFESICILPCIFNMIPVSKEKWSFSQLGLVKTALRSTMSQDQVTYLLVISIEHDLAKTQCYNKVIANFAMNKARRLNFV